MGAPRVLSIVGKSGSGKTTLLEALLPRLKARGLKVGTLKHDVHGFRMDHEGKDTYRHFAAGADRVVIAGPGETALRERCGEPPAAEALVERFMEGMDLVLTEGYRTGSWPKVEVVRRARSERPLCAGDPRLVALVTDLPGPWGVRVFGLGEAEALAAWIAEEFLEKGAP
ncbi:MAG: molybdopterin-guanine dinucleotide biosynthesis protein B [Acidobacteriota bacterium]